MKLLVVGILGTICVMAYRALAQEERRRRAHEQALLEAERHRQVRCSRLYVASQFGLTSQN